MALSKTFVCFISLLYLFFAACDATEFNGEKQGDKEESSSDDEDASLTKEPVLIGGAYLACVEEPQNYSVSLQSATVACGIYRETVNTKADISNWDHQWTVEDPLTGQPGGAANEQDCLPDEPCHKRFQFEDDSFRRLAIDVSLRNKISGQELVLGRNFEPLDKDWPRPTLQALDAFDYSVELTEQSGDGGGDVNILGTLATYGFQKAFEDICDNGEYDSLFGSVRTTINANRIAGVQKLGHSGNSCVYYGNEVKPGHADNCYIMPVKVLDPVTQQPYLKVLVKEHVSGEDTIEVWRLTAEKHRC